MRNAGMGAVVAGGIVWMALILGHSSGSAQVAVAEEPRAEAPPGSAATYHLRVVRIDTGYTIDANHPFAKHGAIARIDWKEALGALLQRRSPVSEPPETLMDQQFTLGRGVQGEVDSMAQIPIERFDNRTDNRSVSRFDRMDSGVSARLKWSSTGLEYALDVRWLHWWPRKGAAPVERTSWQGVVEGTKGRPGLAPGETLLLRNRKTIRDAKGQAAHAELYVFLTRDTK